MINDASQDFEPVTNGVVVNMSMNKQGSRIWADMTQKAYDQENDPLPSCWMILCILLNGEWPITGGNSTITMGSGRDKSYWLKKHRTWPTFLSLVS